MKKIVIILFVLLLPLVSLSQGEDYYSKDEKPLQEEQCECSAQKGESDGSRFLEASKSVGRDIVNQGVVDIYSGAVGDLQRRTQSNGIRGIAELIGLSFASKYAGKGLSAQRRALNRTKRREPAFNGSECNCRSCPYHGTRYGH